MPEGSALGGLLGGKRQDLTLARWLDAGSDHSSHTMAPTIQPTFMRLTQLERDAMTSAAKESFEPEVVVRMFGSTVAQGSCGGDIDLPSETQLRDPARVARAHTRFLSNLYARLGEQKVDVLIDYPKRQQRPATPPPHRVGAPGSVAHRMAWNC